MNQIMSFLKSQPARITSYIIVGILIGNWLGVQYPKASTAFWLQPVVALCMAVATVMASVKNNKAIEAEKIVAQFTCPSSPPNEKEVEILTKAGVEIPK